MNLLLSKIRSIIVNRRLRKRIHEHTKYLDAARKNCFVLICWICREKYEKNGEYYLSKLAEAINIKLLSIYDIVIDDFAEKEEIFINYEVDRLIKIDLIRDQIEKYFKLSLYCSADYSEEANKIFEKAKAFSINADDLRHAEFNELKRAIVSDSKKTKWIEKESRKRVKQSGREKRIYEFVPWTLFRWENLIKIGTIGSAAFLMTGYLYNKYLLAYFNIEASKYFDISDYLATSVDKIELLIKWFIFYLLIIALNEYERRYDRVEPKAPERIAEFKTIGYKFELIMFFAGMFLFFMSIITDNISMYTLCGLGAFLMIIPILVAINFISKKSVAYSVFLYCYISSPLMLLHLMKREDLLQEILLTIRSI